MNIPEPSVAASLARALAVAFSPPTADLLVLELENPLLRALGHAAKKEEGPGFEELFDRLWAELQKLPKDDLQQSLLKLEVEFARLFLVPSKQKIHPYEHIYAGANATKLGFSLAACYQELDLTVSPDHRDLPDHIAAELEFFACACECGDDAKAKFFLRDHLAGFGRSFAAKVLDRTAHAIYEIAAQTLVLLLSQDSLTHIERTEDVEC